MTPIVLYVEDEQNDVFFMKRAFQQNRADVILHNVGDGPSAIAYLGGEGAYSDRQRFPLPNVVLLDINLPGCSGFDVLKWLHGEARIGDLPVVMFSSSARAEDKEKARALGASDFLQKPASGLGFRDVAKQFCQEWLESEHGNTERPETSATS